jgi:hypothetical protein
MNPTMLIAGTVGVGSGVKLCENSSFDHPIHLLDSSKFLILKIGLLPNFASALFAQTRDLLGRLLFLTIIPKVINPNSINNEENGKNQKGSILSVNVKQMPLVVEDGF